jgi:hypothetical protein
VDDSNASSYHPTKYQTKDGRNTFDSDATDVFSPFSFSYNGISFRKKTSTTHIRDVCLAKCKYIPLKYILLNFRYTLLVELRAFYV